MKSWQSILDEQIYIDDTFELDDDNTAFVIDGVLKSYGKKLNITFDKAKKILDDAYKSGFKLHKKEENNKIIFILRRGDLYLEFDDSIDYILHAYVLDKNIIINNFSSIFENHDVKKDINNLDININGKDSILYIKERSNYETYFKYLYIFSKIMKTKMGLL